MKNKIKYCLIICFSYTLLLSGCGTIKEGFSSQKKNSVDEFLVEKKLPLVMPPDFEKLPIPKNNNEIQQDETDSFKSILSKDQEKTLSSSNQNKSLDSNLEQSIINQIKKN